MDNIKLLDSLHTKILYSKLAETITVQEIDALVDCKEQMKEIYNHALDDVDNIITEQLDKSDNQVECQTLRWVLDVLSDLIK